jgi:hypothetical protein
LKATRLGTSTAESRRAFQSDQNEMIPSRSYADINSDLVVAVPPIANTPISFTKPAQIDTSLCSNFM